MLCAGEELAARGSAKEPPCPLGVLVLFPPGRHHSEPSSSSELPVAHPGDCSLFEEVEEQVAQDVCDRKRC